MSKKSLTIRLLVFFFWGIFFFLIAISHIEGSDRLNPILKFDFMRISPQGWGFFTKSPDDGYVLAYEYQAALPNNLMNVKNASSENLFGLSKNNRYIDMEIAQIVSNIPKEVWKQAKGKPENLKIDTYKIVKLNTKLRTFKNGEKYIIARAKPIPQAWANENQEQYNPFMYAAITIGYFNEKQDSILLK